MTIPTPRFNCGDWVYLRQSIATDSGHMTINGKEVARIVQQKRWRIAEVLMVSAAPDNWLIQYQFHHGFSNDSLRLNEHELCDEAEAIAMLELNARNRL